MARPSAVTRTPGGFRPDPEGDPWDLFARVHEDLRRMLAGKLRPFPLLLSEYQALSILSRGALTLGELGRALGLTPAAITDLTRRLRRRALLTREPNPRDARSTVVRLTGRGLATQRKAKAMYRRSLRRVETRISPTALAGLRLGLAGLSMGLGGHRGAPSSRRTTREARR
ncbi:transcriptional regulator, MarR family [mine drainage metagenome]|uniref:Transcriptional regulator, MarR family n=1 Tax=mine drainage metagenome TaxID=410659 RepID=T0Z304_9ZZZZ